MRKGIGQVVWIVGAILLVLILLGLLVFFSGEFSIFAQDSLTEIGNVGEEFAP